MFLFKCMSLDLLEMLHIGPLITLQSFSILGDYHMKLEINT